MVIRWPVSSRECGSGWTTCRTELAHRRIFLGTYLRTTQAVGSAIDRARFEDPAWVEDWDVKFAELYLQAHDEDLGGETGRPGRGGSRSTLPRTCRPCDMCCSGSTRTSTTTCRRPCSR